MDAFANERNLLKVLRIFSPFFLYNFEQESDRAHTENEHPEGKDCRNEQNV